ncbi:sigma-70 family RNA polymerase sigma factor [Paenibacillus piri]|uniref:Sigma-70 family RNA polymerase sigma factor n=1 Tax=Paenibacillus piri TaxID=2547395 RepID=A0A4R5KM68_9BACL|nr:sigma-70 family RNA polymerase sigma factor [Paenibacillus piri]TDF96616.1 sigma-70 family RNA polymerase sigma factor [Paenibacillus piri]
MQQYSDEQLMQQIKEKQSAALRILYDRYVRLVYSFVLKSGAGGDPQFVQDIVQLVFTRIWTTETGYDPGKGQFVNWLITVTRNITIDQLRKRRKQERLVPFDNESTEAELADYYRQDMLQDAVSRMMLKQQIEAAYRFLSNSQVQLIRDFYWDGYTLNEIAERNGEPLGTVKSRLHQALKTLRKQLKPDGEE